MDLDFEAPRKVAKSLSKHLKINVARKTVEIRERQDEFPEDIRKIITKLKNESDPQIFVDAIEDSLLSVIERSILDRKGLCCSETELEVAIRLFPNALWYPLEHIRIAVGTKNSGLFRLQNLVYFVPFVPIYAKLGMESGWYSENERGGLMTYRLGYGAVAINGKRFSLLEYICLWFLTEDLYDKEDEMRTEAVRIDKICASAMKGLRDKGVFRKQDIIDFNLIEYIARVKWRGMHGERLQFMLDLCPEASLAKIKEEGQNVEDEDDEIATQQPAKTRLPARHHY